MSLGHRAGGRRSWCCKPPPLRAHSTAAAGRGAEPYNRVRRRPRPSDALQSVPVPIIGYSVLARGTLTREIPGRIAGRVTGRVRGSPRLPASLATDELQADRIRRLRDVAERAGVSAATR